MASVHQSNKLIERVAVLIDGPNFHMMAQRLGVRIDYAKFVNAITLGKRAVIRKVYCQPSSSSKRKMFYRSLKTKYNLEIIECNEGDDVDQILNNDLRLIAIRDDIDTIVLASGDTDYLEAVNFAHNECGKKIKIVSLDEMMGKRYLGNGFEIVNLRDLKQFIVEDQFQKVDRTTESHQKKKHKRHNNSKTQRERYYGSRRKKDGFR